MNTFKLLLLTLLVNSSCQMQQKNQDVSYNEKTIEQKDVQDTVSVKNTVNEEYPHARNINLESEFLNSVSLFWSDPGYVEGPTLIINAKCWKVSFSTDTFNDDGSVKYTDDYEYYVLKEDNIAFRSNRYHGKGYHGGSFIMMKNELDYRYNDIKAPLVNSKDNLITAIEKLLKE